MTIKTLGLLGLLGAATNPLFAQSDVTQPTDVVFASSANSPGSEGVANAIDGKPTKYLNFDAKNNAATAGFAVTPSVGVTRVTGVAMQAANDAPDRDPKVVKIEGSNDDKLTAYSAGNWELITEIKDIPAFDARFEWKSFSFKNTKPYKHYRWTVVETAGPSSCCFQIAEVELLGSTLPQDITQPTDPVLASSANSPGSEGVANAIDGKPTKYLNFDAKNNAATAGFVVSPAVGKTLVTGVTMQSANDAPDRDPKIVTLEGSNDDKITAFNSGTWKEIVKLSDIPTFDARFETKTFLFDNTQPYKHYRWTVVETAGPSTCCFQIAEVELLGGTPQDVTQPTDAVLASSANSPGSEGVANAIDGKPTKYLNFDAKNNAATAGFVVTPGVGATSIIGVTMQSANDAPDRDPKVVKIEGSNDDKVTAFGAGKWDLIAEIKDIPAYDARFQTQEFYFPPKGSYKHYRWTVVETAGPSSCCFQIAEVELLAVIDSAPPTAKFLTQPVDTPALSGQRANFFVKVDGPWTVQWLKNGQPIPGARGLTYSTEPVTAANQADTYQAEIIGAAKSNIVKAPVFTPSTTKSLGVSFRGQGANGAPTELDTTDIAGVHPQAYWINVSDNTGEETPTDSDNKPGAVTVAWETSNTWGSGTGTDNADRKMLNGYLDPREDAVITFTKVPAGKHSVIAYSVNRPLAFNDADFTVQGKAKSPTIYIRSQNADEYNAAPGFIRGTATSAAGRSVANYVRFDGVEPTAAGTITLTAHSLEEPGEVPDGTAAVNGVQLLISPPEVVAPPTITGQPSSKNATIGGNAVLSVTATGSGTLTYQWRKAGSDIAGATGPQLSIANVKDTDAGSYSVAVSNAGGSTVSNGVVLSIFNGKIDDRLVSYWKFDETSGTSAANSGGGQAGQLRGYTGNAHWSAGKVGGALSFNGSSQYVFVPNYTKPTTTETVSAWVRSTSVGDSPTIIANPGTNTDQNIRLSQFELGLFGTDGDLRGVIVAGPNPYNAREGTPIKLNEWTHVALVADGGRMTIYRDGKAVGGADYLGKITDPTSQIIGIGALLNSDGTISDTGGYWTGQIDEVAVWTRNLGADEIAAIYTAGTTGKGLTEAVIGGSGPGGQTGGDRLAIGKISLSGNNLLIESKGAALERSTDLKTWSAVNGAAANGTFTVPKGTEPALFFRAK